MNQLKWNKFKVEHILINFMATLNPEYNNDEQYWNKNILISTLLSLIKWSRENMSDW